MAKSLGAAIERGLALQRLHRTMQYDDDADAPITALTNTERRLAEQDARAGCALCGAALMWRKRAFETVRAYRAQQEAQQRREQAEREANYWRAERAFTASLSR